MSLREIKLEDAYWFQEGPGVRRWQFTDKGIKLLNVANILKSGKIDLSKTERHLSIEEVENKYSHFLVDEGDLVIASSGISIDTDNLLRTRGAFIERDHLPLCMNTSTIRFKNKDNFSDLKYLRHWLQSLDFRRQITKEVTGIAQKNFGPSHLKRIQIPLPPLEEQKRIAKILDAADALRAKRRQAIAQLDTFLQSTFLDLFGDPVTNPKGWDMRPFSEMGKFNSGATPSKSVDVYWNGSFPWVSPKDMKRSYIVDSIDHVTEAALKRTNLKYIDEKHLLIVVRGMILAHSFPVAINLVPISINQDMKAIFPHADTDVFYLKNCLDVMKSKVLSVISTAAHGTKRFGQTEMEELTVPIPPLELQQRFASFVESVEQQKSKMQTHLTQLDTLFASLQKRAFKGEL